MLYPEYKFTELFKKTNRNLCPVIHAAGIEAKKGMCMHTYLLEDFASDKKDFLGYDLGYKIRKPPLNIFRSGFQWR